MRYDRIVISSGHGKYVRGASGVLDEVEEARRVVEHVADELRARDVAIVTYHDDVSTSQNENLNRIVDFHNSRQRDLDVSVHFNAYVETTKPMGTEVLYITQPDLAAQVSAAISWCGFLNRGAKKQTDLFFLNNTEMPAILIETCFVDSTADAAVYQQQFHAICAAIADLLGGGEIEAAPPSTPVDLAGKVSSFGGPTDEGVAPDEGLAFISDIDQAPQLFLPSQPKGTSGLARRLNPHVHYVACRWDYAQTPQALLLDEQALVRAVRSGIAMKAFPADWGPHESTGRIADISPGLMDDLGIKTDDEVQIIFPYREDGQT
ncbi:N-acetylmuramoyl-L-alanine amidase [Bradyrhizobium sp. AZCC 2289]|uniref:N-acetylmuramoyl-L-alanine amidase n=1 Tax=Bradyrhizobium sp. AZCC 2289 TaxID=3117026 RepID=UPI002FF229F1